MKKISPLGSQSFLSHAHSFFFFARALTPSPSLSPNTTLLLCFFCLRDCRYRSPRFLHVGVNTTSVLHNRRLKEPPTNDPLRRIPNARHILPTYSQPGSDPTHKRKTHCRLHAVRQLLCLFAARLSGGLASAAALRWHHPACAQPPSRNTCDSVYTFTVKQSCSDFAPPAASCCALVSLSDAPSFLFLLRRSAPSYTRGRAEAAIGLIPQRGSFLQCTFSFT